jgi:hypothetical protein
MKISSLAAVVVFAAALVVACDNADMAAPPAPKAAKKVEAAPGAERGQQPTASGSQTAAASGCHGSQRPRGGSQTNGQQ